MWIIHIGDRITPFHRCINGHLGTTRLGCLTRLVEILRNRSFTTEANDYIEGVSLVELAPSRRIGATSNRAVQ